MNRWRPLITWAIGDTAQILPRPEWGACVGFINSQSNNLPAPVADISFQKRMSRSSRRKVDVIMMKDVPNMGLRQYQVANVSPGSARNHLVPTGLAVYAHYLNRKKYESEIARALEDTSAAPEDEVALRESLQRAKLLKRLSSCRVIADVKSNNNEFLEPYGVSQIAKRILEMTNIVVPHELFNVQQPYDSPGTYILPLALLDDDNRQISITVQLTPRQASATELSKYDLESAGSSTSEDNVV